MSKKKGIKWCHRTWNPIVGCSKISEGCQNCYAERFAMRHVNNPAIRDKYTGTANMHGWTGNIKLWEDSLMLPFSWKKPAIIFVNSMGDPFHDNVQPNWLSRIMRVIEENPHLTFLILTKRVHRMADFFRSYYRPDEAPFKNLWLGVTAENQERANERIPTLLGIPGNHFVSLEPMLGPIDLTGKLYISGKANSPNIDSIDATKLWFPQLDWVILGKENGHKARPMSLEWARKVRDDCRAAGVPFFYKGDGLLDGVSYEEFPKGMGGNT